MENQDKGKAFEDDVASMYRQLGYSVSQNEIIGGHQIDMVIEKHVAGFRGVRIVVECKYLSRGSVTNREVAQFLVVLTSVMREEPITGGVMVSSTSFSAQAKAAAKKSGCTVHRRGGSQ